MEQFTVSLEGIELYGYHGLYPGEKLLGSKYQLDLEFRLHSPPAAQIELEHTADYKRAYDIVVEIFKIPTPLLENICKKIALRLKETFQNTTYISVAVAKLSPPIGGICKGAKVRYEIN